MKAIVQKLVAVMLAIIMGICMASAQTKTVRHTVERGETLASIAKRYGTTNEKIIELNPDASQFIYVGMELTVPVSTPSNKSNHSSSVSSASTSIHKYKEHSKVSNNEKEKGNLIMSYWPGYPLIIMSAKTVKIYQ